jgi:hypothetical protein
LRLFVFGKDGQGILPDAGQQVCVGHDGVVGVADFVRNACRQHAKRGQAGTADRLPLQLPVLGDVGNHHHRCGHRSARFDGIVGTDRHHANFPPASVVGGVLAVFDLAAGEYLPQLVEVRVANNCWQSQFGALVVSAGKRVRQRPVCEQDPGLLIDSEDQVGRVIEQGA